MTEMPHTTYCGTNSTVGDDAYIVPQQTETKRKNQCGIVKCYVSTLVLWHWGRILWADVGIRPYEGSRRFYFLRYMEERIRFLPPAADCASLTLVRRSLWIVRFRRG